MKAGSMNKMCMMDNKSSREDIDYKCIYVSLSLTISLAYCKQVKFCKSTR